MRELEHRWEDARREDYHRYGRPDDEGRREGYFESSNHMIQSTPRKLSWAEEIQNEVNEWLKGVPVV